MKVIQGGEHSGFKHLPTLLPGLVPGAQQELLKRAADEDGLFDGRGAVVGQEDTVTHRRPVDAARPLHALAGLRGLHRVNGSGKPFGEGIERVVGLLRSLVPVHQPQICALGWSGPN
uniref:hypothetical protein n=1 Tax=Streptomyces sp. ND04-05B TaxID=3028693 RepID=UPI0029BFB3E3|nr:hypothetical protein [Streptomyces sp. ND04-05B]